MSPLYEYKCSLCGDIKERIQRVGAPAIKCKECGVEMERLIGSPGLRFKGNGFYETDYKQSEVALPSEDE